MSRKSLSICREIKIPSVFMLFFDLCFFLNSRWAFGARDIAKKSWHICKKLHKCGWSAAKNTSVLFPSLQVKYWRELPINGAGEVVFLQQDQVIARQIRQTLIANQQRGRETRSNERHVNSPKRNATTTRSRESTSYVLNSTILILRRVAETWIFTYRVFQLE